ncbi:MAG: hypothetical protein ACJATI_001019 [Halioglobus sp.]|jgi:hypothetical protein
MTPNTSNISKTKALENFILDDKAISDVDSHVNKFNTFRALGLVHHEIRHSNFLGWLLDPYQTHGIDDSFLKIFLKEVFNAVDVGSLGEMNIFELDGLSLSNARVHREWRNIDLLIVDEENNLVIVIENKIWSKESKHQLEKYRAIVEDVYPNYKQILLLLSPNNVAAEHSDHYLSIGYSTVDAAIEKLLKVKGHQIITAPREFIEQYLLMLREDIMDNSNLKKIVAEIYKNHKLAIDTIIQHLPDMYSKYSLWMFEVLTEMAAVGDNNSIVIIDGQHKSHQKFWINDLSFINNDTSWTSTGNVLLFEIQNYGDKMTIDLILGPTSEEYREMIDTIIKTTDSTKLKRKVKLTKYNRYYKHLLFRYDSIAKDDQERFKEKFKTQLEKFIGSDFKLVRQILLENKHTIESFKR